MTNPIPAFEVLKASLAKLQAVNLPLVPEADDLQAQADHMKAFAALASEYLNALGRNLKSNVGHNVDFESFTSIISLDDALYEYANAIEDVDYSTSREGRAATAFDAARGL